MTLAQRQERGLIERLPAVRGRYTENASLAQITWFRVGGPAEVMFRPADEEDLSTFLSAKPADVPVTVIGVGSNLLVRDGGVEGVVVRLGREFAKIGVGGDHIFAGAGALDMNVALTAEEAGLTGFEFLSGIPGTIGGALRMNGGAYGSEVKDIFVRARAVDSQGCIHELGLEDMGFGYRKTGIDRSWTFLDAEFKGVPGDRNEISTRMREIQSMRQETQPVRTPTGGSTFANPPEGKAWELIDQAGCRGLRVGGAMVSEKHCNFLINMGDATAADLEELGETVRRRVKDNSGISLRWEVRRIGSPVLTAEEE